MTGFNQLHLIFLLLCTLIALFHLFRGICARRWLSHFDAEHEVGHGIMAIGMLFMLAPVGSLPSTILRWNILLFALTSCWWIFRLLVRKKRLMLLFRTISVPATFQSDGIHVFMHGGMCYMFLLISSMEFSMTLPAIAINSLLVVSFAFLTLFYSRGTTRDLQASQWDWLQVGANLAHVLMSGMMCWMFLEMIFMTIGMRG